VLFSEGASGSGPVTPVKHVTPVKGVKQVKPVKGVKQVKPVRAVDGLGWSSRSGIDFFRS
jgi:hypothetical protein